MSRVGIAGGTQLYAADAVKNFIRTIALLGKNSSLRVWYLRAVLRTFLVAIFIFAMLLVAGFFTLWSGVGHGWGNVASVLYVLLLLYVSGTVTSLIASSIVQMVAGEKSLLAALPAGVAPHIAPRTPSLFAHRRRELSGIALSLLLSAGVLPLLLFPLALPVGLIVVAWALGQENHKSADRLVFQNGELSTLSVKQRMNFSFHVGLGLVPALLSVFPFVGWLTLPILQMAAVLDVRQLANLNQLSTARSGHALTPSSL